jgi:hypothetical protein
MIEIPFAAFAAVSVPAIRLLLLVTPSFVGDSPALRRERHAFLAVLTAVAGVCYGTTVGSDNVLLIAAWLNLASAVCAYLKAMLDSQDEYRAHASRIGVLRRNRDKEAGHD